MESQLLVSACPFCEISLDHLKIQGYYCHECGVCYDCEELLYANCPDCSLEPISDGEGGFYENEDEWGYDPAKHATHENVKILCDSHVPRKGGLGFTMF